jgi:hypothetical protein
LGVMKKLRSVGLRLTVEAVLNHSL